MVFGSESMTYRRPKQQKPKQIIPHTGETGKLVLTLFMFAVSSTCKQKKKKKNKKNKKI